jgi:hypothetical protein
MVDLTTAPLLEVDQFVFETEAAYKKAVTGRVHSQESGNWGSEYLTCSFKASPLRLMSASLPGTPPTITGQATTYGMLIQTGSTVVSDMPLQGGGRVYCVKDANDASGNTWVTVLTSSIHYLQAQGRSFNSTGSDKDFVLTDWIAPWHVTGSALMARAYQPKVFACWRTSGSQATSIAGGPDTITEISASNKLGWIFYPDAGVLKFHNGTQDFTFTNFTTYEENVASLSDYTDAGWHILSQTKTTTEHTITLGGAWASGSLASPTWRAFTDIVTACTGAITSSCVAVEGYRYIGAYSQYA